LESSAAWRKASLWLTLILGSGEESTDDDGSEVGSEMLVLAIYLVCLMEG
jgi:hypothetical protein